MQRANSLQPFFAAQTVSRSFHLRERESREKRWRQLFMSRGMRREGSFFLTFFPNSL